MLTDGSDPWWREALCAQVGADLFFLKAGEPGNEAKAVCRLCPVRAQCLADDLESGPDENGIFGGFGRDDRRAFSERVEAGEDPMEVAFQALEAEERALIEKQERRRERRATANHQRRVSARRNRDRLHQGAS